MVKPSVAGSRLVSAELSLPRQSGSFIGAKEYGGDPVDGRRATVPSCRFVRPNNVIITANMMRSSHGGASSSFSAIFVPRLQLFLP